MDDRAVVHEWSLAKVLHRVRIAYAWRTYCRKEWSSSAQDLDPTRATHLAVTVLASVALACVGIGVLRYGGGQPPVSDSGHTGAPPISLDFRELVDFRNASPKLADKAMQLAGKRVKMAGYVAHLESPASGGFYLTPVPVHGDESGGGTADLPLESVFVQVRGIDAISAGVLDGAVEVSGTLAVGLAEDAEGRSSWLRITAD
jgi:hypothetical protein